MKTSRRWSTPSSFRRHRRPLRSRSRLPSELALPPQPMLAHSLGWLPHAPARGSARAALGSGDRERQFPMSDEARSNRGKSAADGLYDLVLSSQRRLTYAGQRNRCPRRATVNEPDVAVCPHAALMVELCKKRVPVLAIGWYSERAGPASASDDFSLLVLHPDDDQLAWIASAGHRLLVDDHTASRTPAP
jgi:hypothetical protein